MNDQYNNYTILDFAQEDSFIRWVRGTDEKAAVFWEDWLAQHPEKAADINAARQLVTAVRIEEETHPPQQVDRIWDNISKEVESPSVQQAKPKVRSIKRWLPYAAAAASVALLIFFLLPKANPTQELLAKSGEQKAYYLPDSSEVRLNAGSRVLVNIEDWTEKRTVELEGEAFFKVRKGSQFTVQTPNGTVQVLGTSFNVNARAGELIVDCFTGKVKVSANKVQEATVLTPLKGVKLSAGASEWTAYAVNPSRQATWRDGMFYFEKSPLVKVFAELERQFNVEIQADEKEYLREYNGFFDRRDIDKAFNSVCYPMDLNYERNGDVVKIVRK